MRIRLILATLLFATLLFPASGFAARFDELFLDKTMRVDFFHTGNHGEEVVALDRVVSDGPWPGSRTHLIDSTNLGSYYFEVLDRETNQPVFSHGFSSVYGEWETTDDAKLHAGTFHESLRFPWPRKPVQVVLKKRDKENAFQQIWSTVIDPGSRYVNKADVKPLGKVWTIFENGPASEKVDLLVIGEGYTEGELTKFHTDAKRMVAKLFATEPFKSRQKDFNVRAIDLPAAQSGVNRPRTSDDRRTATSVQYNIFDSERYVLTFDNRAMRDIASAAPYDFLEILVNEKTYGGGGIFNDQATASVDSAFSEYVFVHEFGHHFAGLGDEYYTSDVAYETGGEKPEPWEPNLTASGTHPKWFDMVDKDVPLPTPWDKAAFEEHSKAIQARRRQIRAQNQPESVMDALFREERDWETKFLDHDQKYAGNVGAFEGAGYEPKGLYRPQVDCIMFTRDEVGFCRVCQRAISHIIDIYSH